MRLIDADALLADARRCEPICRSMADIVDIAWLIEDQPTVDAVPVDEIVFHYIIIDKNGIPEVKLQFGERILVLRTDPVDAKPVAHGRWILVRDKFGNAMGSKCNECGRRVRNSGENYCPNCGADMREGKENEETDD